MQSELNDMEVGPVFNTCGKTSQMMALIFFGMVYSPGLPILMPISFFAFLLYFNLDKRLLFRYNYRPQKIDDAIIQSVLVLLPYAALLRLAFACWMYSSSVLPDLFPSLTLSTSMLSAIPSSSSVGSHSINSKDYLSFLASYETYGGVDSIYWIQTRVLQPNVFPLFVVFVFIILCKALRRLWKQIPFNLLLSPVYFLARCCCRRKKSLVYSEENGAAREELNGFDLMQQDDDLRQEMAPYTGEYYCYLYDKREMKVSCGQCCKPKNRGKLPEQEILDGWLTVEQGDYVVKTKIWTHSSVTDGVTRIRGDYKKTFEVVRDNGCFSYNLEKIPAYTLAIVGMREGASNVAEYKRLKEKELAAKRKKKNAMDPRNAWQNDKSNKSSMKTGKRSDQTRVFVDNEGKGDGDSDGSDDDDDDDDSSDDDDDSDEDSESDRK